MRSFIKSIRWNTCLSALFCILLGAALFLWPSAFTSIACRVVSLLLIFIGCINLIAYLAEKERVFRSLFDLIAGAVLLILGLWMRFQPDFFINLIPYVLGAIILVHGVQDIRYSLTLQRQKYGFWWLVLLLAIFTTGFGLVIISHANRTMDAIIQLMGVALIYDGISDFWIVSRLSHAARRFGRDVQDHFQTFQDTADGVVYTVKDKDIKIEDPDD